MTKSHFSTGSTRRKIISRIKVPQKQPSIQRYESNFMSKCDPRLSFHGSHNSPLHRKFNIKLSTCKTNYLLLRHRSIACKTIYLTSFRFTSRLSEILPIWIKTTKTQLIKEHFSMKIPSNLKTINLTITTRKSSYT